MTVQLSQPGHVLYVEDEEADVYFMRTAFDQAGLGPALRVVGDGRAAIHYISNGTGAATRDSNPLPKVILLDLNLPIVSGFEVLEWLRSQSDHKEVPVIVFSSSGRDEDRERAMSLGATDFVQKPPSGMLFGGIVKHIKEKWL